MAIPTFPVPQVQFLDPFMELMARRDIRPSTVRGWQIMQQGARHNPGFHASRFEPLNSGVIIQITRSLEVEAPNSAGLTWTLAVRVWVRFSLEQHVSDAHVATAQWLATNHLETWWVQTHLVGPDSPLPACPGCILNAHDAPGLRISYAAARSSVAHRLFKGTYPTEEKAFEYAFAALEGDTSQR